MRKYNWPCIVYVPPGGELRGGAWVVIDSAINKARCFFIIVTLSVVIKVITGARMAIDLAINKARYLFITDTLSVMIKLITGARVVIDSAINKVMYLSII